MSVGLEVDRCAQDETVGPPTASSVRVVEAPDPRDHRAVVEADHELGPHLHRALEALDDPDDVGVVCRAAA